MRRILGMVVVIILLAGCGGEEQAVGRRSETTRTVCNSAVLGGKYEPKGTKK
jgi:hypothetical protein